MRAACTGDIMIRTILIGAGLQALSFHSAAAEPGALPATEISAEDTIIVTATRNPENINDVIVPVRVISRADIELSLANDIAELLRFEAGFDIGRNGGPGQATSLFLRGTDSNHTLVMVDGVRINPGTLGGAALQNISPDMIEQIEIVKGARSALYGTDAIGGVINIITRRSASANFELGLQSGSFNTRSANLSAGNHGGGGDYGITINWQDTDGYPPRTDSDIERGYDNLSLNLYGARRVGSSEIGFRHWQASGNVEYLDFFLSPVDQDFKNSTSAIQVDTAVGNNGSSKAILAYMIDDIEQSQSPDFVESSRVSLDWQYAHALDRHTLTGGLYLFEENAESLSFGSGFDEDTRVGAVYVQDQIDFDRQRAFLALRFTDHESSGNQVTWNAEYAFDLGDAWTLGAGIGHAFRAPDATDRFGFGGTPDLDAETADNLTATLKFAPAGPHRIELEYYRDDIDDLIEFDFSTFTLQNIDQASIRGTEVTYEYSGPSFSLRAELLSQRADNTTTGTRLLRRAEKTATLQYTQRIGMHRLGVSLLATGDREDFGGAVLDSYVLVNLTGQLQISPHWRLNTRVENLFDTSYETAEGYRMQELSGFLELTYGWR
jgi:vitamin B12 transporter